jgi:membrane protein implicated in regulation of membrane protease activity
MERKDILNYLKAIMVSTLAISLFLFLAGFVVVFVVAKGIISFDVTIFPNYALGFLIFSFFSQILIFIMEKSAENIIMLVLMPFPIYLFSLLPELYLHFPN